MNILKESKTIKSPSSRKFRRARRFIMHVISMNDFGLNNPLESVLELAEKMLPWAKRNTCDKQFPHHKAVLLFMESSTRTQYSTEQAVKNLGMRRTMVSGVDHTSVLKGESFADTFRMFVGQGARILALRTKIEGGPLFAAKVCQEYIEKISIINPGPVSIINCGDGTHFHPTQTCLDAGTIKLNLGRLNNFTLGIMGDPRKGRTAHSLFQEFAKREGMKFVIVAPKGFGMPISYMQGVKNVVESDSLEALADCDIVYVTRFQRERMTEEEKRFIESVRRNYVINRRVLDSWNPKVRIMHPLPRVDEIDPEISLDKRIIAFRQAEYGIPTRMAIIVMLCEKPYVPYTLPLEPNSLIVDTHEKRIDNKKPVKYFQPVSEGMVVDHIPAGKIDFLFKVLDTLGELKKESPRQFVQYVKTAKYPNGKKDVLLLHNYQLPDFAAATIQALFPKTTINYLPGDNTIIKKRFCAPVAISNNVHCSNENCITNHDREAKPNFIFHKIEDGAHDVICEYCDTPLWS